MVQPPNVPGPSSTTSQNAAAPKSGPKTPLSTELPPPQNPASQSIQTDYIDPPKRRLGPHKSAVNEPLASDKLIDPVKFQLRKLVGLTIASGTHRPAFSGDFLEEVTELTAQFMGHFVESLHKLTEVQRHHKPGIADVEMCLLAQNVSPSDLYSEYVRTKALDPPVKAHARRITADLDHLLREYNAENYTLDKNDASLVFHANEQHEIAALVPRQAKRREYIPEYLPDLPPDFTFTSTGNYLATTTDLKEIKLRMAEQSRLNEGSLYKLIDDDERRWKQALERDLEALASSDTESVVEEIMSPTGDKTATDVETPDMAGHGDKGISTENNGDKHVSTEKDGGTNVEGENAANGEITGVTDTAGQTTGTGEPPGSAVTIPTGNNLITPSNIERNTKHFDFVEYARKRRRARERYTHEMERRRQARRGNVFLKAETVFSPYAVAPPSMADTTFFEGVLDASFKKVIRATRVAEHKKKQRIDRLREERRVREQQQQEENGAFEFGFAFNPADNLSEDSDDDEFLETTKEFDFGDESQKAPDFGDSIMNDVSATEHSPRQGQVSGKAPLKAPAEHKKNQSSEAGDEFDGNSDLEDELEQHFGFEDAGDDVGDDAGDDKSDAGLEFTQHFGEEHSLNGDDEENGSENEFFGDTDPVTFAETPMDVSQEGPQETPQKGFQETKDHNQSTRVSWGDLGSDESEEDELEDVE